MKKILAILAVTATVMAFSTCGDVDEVISNMADVGVYVGLLSFDGAEGGTLYDLIDAKAYGEGAFSGTLTIGSYSNTLSSNSLIYLNNKGNKVLANDLLTNLVDEDNNFNTTDYKGTDVLKGLIQARYRAGTSDSNDSTPLFSAVNQSINIMKNGEAKLPATLNNVTIVTFTDGNDQGSEDFDGQTDEKIQDRIRGTWNGETSVYSGGETVKGQGINAIAIAVPGDSSFASSRDANLAAITSGTDPQDKSVYEATNFNSLNTVFEDVANSLKAVQQISSFTLTISGPSKVVNSGKFDNDGINFAATFDGAGSLEASQKLLKGKVVKNSDNTYSITDITYEGGIGPSSNTTANQSGKQGARVEFYFGGFTGADANSQITEYYVDSNGAWQQLEALEKGKGFSFAKAEPKSAIVYLVLDATLTTEQVTAVRTAANTFIDKLYNLATTNQ
ncbi:MAG: hypothetical protein LBE74_08155 [Treponema sp.]|jgi:hypothetical protein|nr:hypothetical protein [Treponema sp.]